MYFKWACAEYPHHLSASSTRVANWSSKYIHLIATCMRDYTATQLWQAQPGSYTWNEALGQSVHTIPSIQWPPNASPDHHKPWITTIHIHSHVMNTLQCYSSEQHILPVHTPQNSFIGQHLNKAQKNFFCHFMMEIMRQFCFSSANFPKQEVRMDPDTPNISTLSLSHSHHLQPFHSPANHLPLRSAGTRNFFLSMSGMEDLGTFSTMTWTDTNERAHVSMT